MCVFTLYTISSFRDTGSVLFGVGAAWIYLVAPHLHSLVIHFNSDTVM